MKKKYLFFALVFISPAYANVTPTTPWGTAMNNSIIPNYLVGAADAWNSIIPGIGPNGRLADDLIALSSSNLGDFKDVMAAIAYNGTTLAIFEVTQHLNNSFYNISQPMLSRRSADKKYLVFDSYLFGGITQFESKYNGDFDTKRWGGSASIKAFLSEGFMIGLGFSGSTTETDDEHYVYADITSTSFSVFAEYLSSNGIFVNASGLVGKTDWENEKKFTNVTDVADFDTNFYAAQINTGAQLGGDVMIFTPQIGARYFNMSTEKHTDSVLQVFDDWDHSAFTGFGEFKITAKIPGSDVQFRPSFFIGASYDAITGGSDNIGVTLINNSKYYIPIDAPDPLGLNSGLGFAMIGPGFETALEYKMDIRTDFMAHNLFLNLKISF